VRRLGDAAIHDEIDIVGTGQRMVLDHQRIQHGPHRAGDHLLADVELAHRAALRHDHQIRDLKRHRQRGQGVRQRGETACLHQQD